MAELKQVKRVFTFDITINEVEYIRDITQNALYDNENGEQYFNRKALFKAMSEALDNNNEHL